MIKTITARHVLVLLLSLFSTSASIAQTVDIPALQEGDTWVYKRIQTQDLHGTLGSMWRQWQLSITRIGSQTFTLSTHPDNTDLPPTEQLRNIDWSTVQSINGKNTVTQHPYDFPLTIGKTWTVEYQKNNVTEHNKVERSIKHYTVVGWVDVTVPAGNFHALKVEMEGEWILEWDPVSAAANAKSGNMMAATADTKSGTKFFSGKLYDAFWYVPEIKSHVKKVSEMYYSNGLLKTRTTGELVSFQVH